jgi:hypothetical protein
MDEHVRKMKGWMKHMGAAFGDRKKRADAARRGGGVQAKEGKELNREGREGREG